MITVYATPKFAKQARRFMTEEALQALVNELFLKPNSGVLLKGTGGIRKIRWQTGKGGKGKRGGIRVLYHYDYSATVLLILLFRKTEKDNITAEEKTLLKRKLLELYRGNKNVQIR